MMRIAADPDGMDLEDWTPSKLNLSVPLMWDILLFNCTTDTPGTPSAKLLDASIAPRVVQEDQGEDSILEIVVATAPEITIDTTDGGQEAPSLPSRTRLSSTSTREIARNIIGNEPSFEFIDNLTFNTTPWLYANPSHFATLGDSMGWYEPSSAMNDNRAAPWWEGGNFSSAMFN